MKTRITALLLALVMVFAMTTVATAAGAGAKLTVVTGLDNGQVKATVYLKGGEGLTNGQITVAYNSEAATLEGAQSLLTCGASSVNKEEAGKVSFAWVGSQLTKDETAIFSLTFRFTGKGDLKLTATAPEAYAGEKAVAIKDGSAVATCNPFTDIDKHWAKEDILKAYYAGLFKGVTETKFAPEKKLDRAMFVTVLYRLAGCPEVKDANTGFKDVKKGEYYEAAVAWAVENGITKGLTDKHFGPHKLLERQEAATMLYRFAEALKQDVSKRTDLSKYKDSKKIANWAEDAMSWAVAEGLLEGYPNNTLMPKGNTTRAEAAVIVVRFAGI